MRSLFCAAFCGGLFFLVPSVALAQLRAVALYAEPAPGASGLFDFFNAPVINSSGAVAFVAELDDGAIGLWSEADGVGQLQNAALSGDPAPGASGLFIESVDSLPHFNDLGHVAFTAFLDDFSQAIYTDRDRPSTPLTLIAREGDAAPDTAAGRTYQFGFDIEAFGGTHDGVAFKASLSPTSPPNNFGSEVVYSEGTGGPLTNIVEFGELAPGTFRPASGNLASYVGLGTPTSNNSGHVAFWGETNAGTGASSVGAAGVWTNSPSGAVRDVALQGRLAPGTTNEFSQFFGGVPVINDDGDIAFTAVLSGLIGGQLREGVWVERGGAVQKVALESEAAPGTASTFEDIDSDPLIDAAGAAVFSAILTDGRKGIWQESSPGNLDLLAIEGGASPVSGMNFGNFVNLAVNDAGQVAFFAELDDFDTRGIFATDATGELIPVVVRGDVIDLGDVILEVDGIEFLGLTGLISQSSVTSGLNNAGQIAFAVEGEVQDGLGGTGEFIQAIVVSDAAMGDETLPGDFNEDGVVDAVDYAVWREGLGGEFTTNDFVLWRGNFGATASASAYAIPEPASALLLAVMVVGCRVQLGRNRTA